MKYPMNALKNTLACLVLMAGLSAGAQGDTYSNPIVIPLDGQVYDYTTSSGTGNNVLCTDNGTTPVTWFSFTTNGAGNCPLFFIAASDDQPCEIAFYTSISGNINNNMETASSMCFYDGFGLWAPAETFIVTSGKTYYLRVKTSTDCTLRIGGQEITPSNDDCPGATSIGVTATSDNNSCHLPGPGVTPDQLCAFTLENTAFYQFYVDAAGSSIINISNILCDNGNNNNNNGFQIGFFTGDCNSLTPLSCTSGVGNFVQATSPPLPAGTRVYVAIDGTSGSNCSYYISGINVTTVLEGGIRDFAVWEAAASNVLSWKTHREFNGHTILVERSADARTYVAIGQIDIPLADGRERSFRFEDNDPLPHGFYRLVILSQNHSRRYSMVKESKRTKGSSFNIQFQNPVYGRLNATLHSPYTGKIGISITNNMGQVLFREDASCRAGSNFISKDLSFLGDGKYYITLRTSNQVITRSFVKLKH